MGSLKCEKNYFFQLPYYFFTVQARDSVTKNYYKKDLIANRVEFDNSHWGHTEILYALTGTNRDRFSNGK